jgi:hypothetical protein
MPFLTLVAVERALATPPIDQVVREILILTFLAVGASRLIESLEPSTISCTSRFLVVLVIVVNSRLYLLSLRHRLEM